MTETSYQRLFAERLGGVTGDEVVGLLAAAMRKEFHSGTSSNGSKTVRTWQADLLGIPVKVVEVTTGVCKSDYHVSNIELEFDLCMSDGRHMVAPSGSVHAVVRFGNKPVFLSYPEFEGDLDTYRHDMSMIRLMALGSEPQPEDIMLPQWSKRDF